ncbi:(Fe-S)-binding protein [Pseudodesulfovibrio cashew]|uniref:(Fe-S)-binding protein n=1 Tax=Pseudodesulfovibrio cashew TaxID=2678688 RepID=A0A6I6J7D8_9BACT|nr:(Fe-S)-binding protein [Pseudodesulfovibrio cashew]QGY38716.1 (Fe-S)-binding protein [Pseudodesulfovibrio cashew]
MEEHPLEILGEALKDAVAEMDVHCTDCGACSVRCAFLKEKGTPGRIAEMVRTLPCEEWPDPFHCSLCGLCGAICPEGLRPEKLFLAMRRELVRRGRLGLKPYKPILFYESVGDSELFSFFRLPQGGDTVLFPGCALPSTRPATVRRLFETLEEIVPSLGVALGCCIKPSFDLGREDFFRERFGALRDKLLAAGVRRVITACPNCQKVFAESGGPLESVTAYALLDEAGYAPKVNGGPPVVVHDACPQRHDEATRRGVRALAERCAVVVERTPAEGLLTRCCGEGGMVGFVRPDLAQTWTDAREKTVAGKRVLTSCAGCANYLGRRMEAVHILDVVFGTGGKRPLRPPLTYGARLLLKRWFKRRFGKG